MISELTSMYLNKHPYETGVKRFNNFTAHPRLHYYYTWITIVSEVHNLFHQEQ